jgi:hypothetical protein
MRVVVLVVGPLARALAALFVPLAAPFVPLAALFVPLAALFVSLAALFVPIAARAQAPSVAHGATLYAEADFEGAIVELERALADQTLSAEDVELALDRIAAAQLALGSSGLDRTLGRLALVAPEHRFGPDVPQALSDRFGRLAPSVASISLSLETEALPSGRERIRAITAADSLRAVRVIELRCGDALDTGRSAELEVSSGAACEAVARGPGGLPLARARREAHVDGQHDTTSSTGSGDDALWIGLGIGGGVLVLTAIFVGVGFAASSGGQSITVVGPRIDF